MQKTMKEVMLYEKQDLRLVESPVPKCGPTDVLLKIRACAICPTDLRKYAFGKIGSPLLHLPMNMGHEWTGDVIETGQYVSYPKVGMRVRAVGFLGYAEYGLINVLSPGVPGMPTRRGSVPRSLEELFVPLSDNVSYEEGTFVENITICMHAIIDQANIGVGKTVVIIGAGQMGLTHIMISKLIGARVIVSELIDWRRELAKKYGADYVIDASKEDPVKEVEKITNGAMADGAIITVGVPAAIYHGLNVLGRGGRAVLFGGATLDTTITFNPNLIHYGDRGLVGCSYGGPWRGRLAIDLIASKKIPVKGLYTHTFKLEELPDAFKKITKNNLSGYLKGMVIP